MDKNMVKVIEIKSRLNNGNVRTIYAIAALNVTINECCRKNNVPCMSIISASETKPMKYDDAATYATMKLAELYATPNTMTKTIVRVA